MDFLASSIKINQLELAIKYWRINYHINLKIEGLINW